MLLKDRFIAAGFTGKLLCHVMGWFGDGNIHRMNRYQSNDPYVIAHQLECMQAVGIDGVIFTWQGPLAPFQHETAQIMAVECGERNMPFVLLLDPWAAKLGKNFQALASSSAVVHVPRRKTLTEPAIMSAHRKELAALGQVPNYTANVTDALNDPTSQAMLNSFAYVPEKYVLDFGTGANLATLGTTFPALKFLAMDQGFSWISIPTTTPVSGLNAVAVSALAGFNKNPAMKIPGLCRNFMDSGMPTPAGVQLAQWTGSRDFSQSVWGGGPARVLDGQAGHLFFDQLPITPMGTPYAAIVTWNDHDEQTEIESFASMFTGIQI